MTEAKDVAGDPRAHFDYAAVEPAVAVRIRQATGIDVSGLTHGLDYGHVRHIISRHGPTGTADQSVTEADFDAIPEVVANPDTVGPGSEAGTIEYRKAAGDPQRTWIVIEFIRGTTYRKLMLKTMYKTK